jgi:hypothetical protein
MPRQHRANEAVKQLNAQKRTYMMYWWCHTPERTAVLAVRAVHVHADVAGNPCRRCRTASLLNATCHEPAPPQKGGNGHDGSTHHARAVLDKATAHVGDPIAEMTKHRPFSTHTHTKSLTTTLTQQPTHTHREKQQQQPIHFRIQSCQQAASSC